MPKIYLSKVRPPHHTGFEKAPWVFNVWRSLCIVQADYERDFGKGAFNKLKKDGPEPARGNSTRYGARTQHYSKPRSC
jgi:hypothetical protein